jgi:hypothetical protein
MPTHSRIEYRCSFCGKHQEQVHHLIAGPGGVYICDECIELCYEIITDDRQPTARSIDRVRTLMAETSARFDRDPSLCPLCRNPLQEDEDRLVVASYGGETGEPRHILWRCHASCFRQHERRFD